MHSVVKVMPANSCNLQLGVKAQPTSSIQTGSTDGTGFPDRTSYDRGYFETMQNITPENIKTVVLLPEGEDLREWLAANVSDFCAEVSLLYDLCKEDATRFKFPGEGFPRNPGLGEEWGSLCVQRQFSSPQYVRHVLAWVDSEVEKFPEPGGADFKAGFTDSVKQIMFRLLGIFDIIYHSHMRVITQLDAARQLNTTFMRFVFFALEFNLVENIDLVSRQPITREFKLEYSKRIE